MSVVLGLALLFATSCADGEKSTDPRRGHDDGSIYRPIPTRTVWEIATMSAESHARSDARRDVLIDEFIASGDSIDGLETAELLAEVRYLSLEEALATADAVVAGEVESQYVARGQGTFRMWTFLVSRIKQDDDTVVDVGQYFELSFESDGEPFVGLLPGTDFMQRGEHYAVLAHQHKASNEILVDIGGQLYEIDGDELEPVDESDVNRAMSGRTVDDLRMAVEERASVD